MNWKYLIPVFFVLILMGSVFAAPASTATNPGTLINGQLKTLTFTLKDENGAIHIVYDSLKVYYSGSTAGGYNNLIINDTNLDNGVGVVCADSNFITAKTCTYAWTVPSTLPAGYYSVDLNFIVQPSGVGYTSNSGLFKVETVVGCSGFIVLAGLIALVLAAFGVMRLLNGNVDVKTLTTLALAVVLALVIITQFSQGVCVIV